MESTVQAAVAQVANTDTTNGTSAEDGNLTNQNAPIGNIGQAPSGAAPPVYQSQFFLVGCTFVATATGFVRPIHACCPPLDFGVVLF